jgi:hypothetical protein
LTDARVGLVVPRTWRYCDELIRFDRDNEDGLYVRHLRLLHATYTFLIYLHLQSPASYVLADFITWLLPGFSFPALFTSESSDELVNCNLLT